MKQDDTRRIELVQAQEATGSERVLRLLLDQAHAELDLQHRRLRRAHQCIAFLAACLILTVLVGVF